MRNFLYVISILAFCTFECKGQSKLSLDEILAEGLKNNGAVHAGQYDIEAQQMNRKTSFDLGYTYANLMYGQYNSIYQDNNITVNQTFYLPNVYTNQAKLNTASATGSEKRLQVTENDLRRRIKSVYYRLLYFQSYRKLLLYQDSLYNEFVKASTVRYKTGETNFLEQLTAESQSMQVKTLLSQAEADILIQQNQLKTLLNTEVNIVLKEDTIYKLNYTMSKDTSAVVANPYLSYLNSQTGVANAFLGLERAKALPNFNLGYSNQTLQGLQSVNGQDRFFTRQYRFQYVQFGMGIPLWYRPYYARINVAKLNKRVAEANVQLYKRTLQGDYLASLQEYAKFNKSLSYYENSSLPQAQRLIANAFASYKSGDIGYLELIQALSRALTVKSDYLKTINDYNQSVITIQYLAGE